MVRRKVLRLAASLFALLCPLMGLASVQAQSVPQPGPIILNIAGDLWVWERADQPLEQLTSWGMNGHPILSPDGTRAAYLSKASIFVEWTRTSGGSGGYTPPENIWVLDIPSANTFRVADQPANAVWDGPSNPGRYALRSQPSWSPNGQQLVWIELQIDTITFTEDQHAGTAQAVIYDLASRTNRVLDLFPISRSLVFAEVFDVQWGRAGIAVKTGVGAYANTWDLRVFTPSGETITDVHFEENSYATLFSGVWINDGAHDHLFDPHLPNTWLDWQTGQYETMSTAFELFSTGAPDGATFVFSEDRWYLALPGQDLIELGDSVQPYGISRDGQAVVYGHRERDPATGHSVYTVIVHSRSQLIEVGQYRNIHPVWGPVGWRVKR